MVIQIGRIVIAAALTTMLAACGVDCTEEMHGVPLEINSITVSPVKAVITSTSFPTGNDCSIGVFLKAEDGNSDYDGQSWCNIEYSRRAGSTSWTSSKPVILSETPGTLYAYYPFSSSVTDIAGIPVRSSINGDDYLYAIAITGLNSSSPSPTLSMKHSMALISVTFIKDASYTGPCLLSSLTLSGEGFGATATLDARDGSFTTVTPGPLVFTGFSHTIVTEGTTEPVLAVPALVSGEKQDVAINCEIDGVTYNVTLKGQGDSGKGVIIKQGVHSHINLTLKDKALVVSGVSTEEWNNGSGSASGSGLDNSGIYTTTGEDGTPGGNIEI